MTSPNIPYDAPYLDEEEHAALNHSGIPGVGGGGGGADEHLTIASNSLGQSLDSGVPFIVPFSNPSDVGPFIQRGTDITHAPGNPTRVTINSTGVYDLNAGTLVLGSSPDLSLPVGFTAELYVNGVTDPRNITFSIWHQLMVNGQTFVFNQAASGWELEAGDYLELVVNGSDGNSNPAAALFIYGALSVTRRL